MNEAFTFNDALIIPKFSDIESRKDVDLSFNGSGYGYMSLPVISANMDTVTESKMAQAMQLYGAEACLHRFQSIEDNVKMFQNSVLRETGNLQVPMVSIGLGKLELERAQALVDAQAFCIVVDVANGAQLSVVKQVKALRELFKDNVSITVGNFASVEGVKEFLERSGFIVDGIKVGIGPGCFSGGTRILMANGTYKNIEDIKVHDKVINKNGEAVNVVGVKYSGIRKLKKYKNNLFYKNSYVTPDHQHWIGDYSTTKNIQDVGLSRILDKLTKNDESKYKWKSLEDSSNSVFLLPKNIIFEIKKEFEIDLGKFYESRRNYSDGFIEMKKIGPSYELGYLIGTFLGDGSAKLYSYRGSEENSKRNTSACISWFFGKNELDLATKVQNCLLKVFGANSIIKKTKNMNIVVNKNNYLARFFLQFGKRQNKNLPETYLCEDKDYLKGMYDGMLDSDGSYHKDGRNSFSNTSIFLCELFMLLSYKILGYYPSIIINEPTIGGLKNCNINNVKESYTLRTVLNPEWGQTKDYQICRTYSIEDYEIELPTYDIEVDCPTHSFIANNVIVHNSACTTRIKTGIGYPQLSAIIEISKLLKKTGLPIIADGGLKNSGDIAKAIGAGASMVMLGSMLAGTDESPGELVNNLGRPLEFLNDGTVRIDDWVTHKSNVKVFKKYRGSASKESYVAQGKDESWRTAEGESFYVPYKGPVKKVLQEIEGGLRSAFTYTGSMNMKNFHANCEFVRVSSSTVVENKAHGQK